MDNQTLNQKIKILEAIMSKGGAYYCANLTQNVISGTIYESASGQIYNANELLGLPDHMKLTEYLAYWGNRLPKGEQAAYFAFFDLDHLCSQYKNGKTDLHYTYWSENVFHQPMLAEQHVLPYQSEENGDIWAIIYINDLTEEYHKEQRHKLLEQNQLALARDLRDANRVNQQQTNRIKAISDELAVNAEKLDAERQFLNVLARKYTLVYYVNLVNDKATMLRMSDLSNVAKMEYTQSGTTFPFEAHIADFAEKYVIQEKQLFKRMLSREYVELQLKEIPRFAFRFSGVPNSMGNQHFEVQVMRVNPDRYDGEVIVASQAIDDLVEIEKKHQREIDNERQFLDVLTRDFEVVYHVDLYENTSTMIKVAPALAANNLENLSLRQTNTFTQRLDTYCQKLVAMAYRDEFLRVMDPQNLLRELKATPRFIYRYRTIRTDARHHFFEVEALRMKDDLSDGNILIAFRDIDDVVTAENRRQIKLEEKLEQERTQNEVLAALGSIYHAIFRIDLQADSYTQISCKEEVRHYYNGDPSASKMLNNVCENIIAPKHRKRMLAFFDLSTLSQRLENEDTVETDCVTTEGNWHRPRFIVRRRDRNGKATHVLYLTQLINDEKHYEQNLIARAEYADYANQSKTNFVSQVAHDIRTPMNSIFGFLEIAEANMGNWEKVQYSLEKIRQSGEFLKDLVNDVLDVSRMEQGKMKLMLEEHDLPKLLEEFAVLIKNAKFDKTQAIRVDVRPMAHRRVVVDSMRLRQIYTNLLTNAIKYTPDGGTIDFVVYQEEIPNTNRVCLVATISDTGIGMSEEFMEKMFTKFERETDTRINKVSGYGLGLPIVKQLVELMGGTIDVKSKLGQGTTFCVRLEVPYVDEIPTKKEVEKVDYEDACAGMNILVAEDNVLNREVITELLAMHNISCLCAEDGLVCVEHFRQAPCGTFDAILMDMQMPNMNGLEATRVIREMDLPWAKTIPIIAMTANALKNDVEKCLEAGMNIHLSKPVNMDKLLKTLAELKETV